MMDHNRLMRMSLDSLPPRYRAQAEARLAAKSGVSPLVLSPHPKTAANRTRHPIMDVRKIPCSAMHDSSRGCVNFTFDINPAIIPTAQQKGIDFKHGIVYTKSHIRHAGQLFKDALAPFAHLAAPFAGLPLFVMAQFFFAYPKSVRPADRIDGAYNVHNGDADNYWKGVGDSFTAAGVWRDDREIAILSLAKRRTNLRPRVEVSVAPAPCPEDLFSFVLSNHSDAAIIRQDPARRQN